MVFAVTCEVGIEKDTEGLPAAMVADAGGVTAGELLDRVTTAPCGGAWPFNIMMACGCAPPLMLLGEIVSDFSDGGRTFTSTDALPEFNVAVSVTGVVVVTCPACTWN